MQLTSIEIQALHQVAAKAGVELAEKQDAEIQRLIGRVNELVEERDELRRGRDQWQAQVTSLNNSRQFLHSQLRQGNEKLLAQQRQIGELQTTLAQTDRKLKIAEAVIKIHRVQPERAVSCRHEATGGIYEYLGIAKGAGTMKGGMFEVYRDPRDDRLYFRTIADFSDRMTVLS